MEIILSTEALNWFKEEMAVKSGDSIQFFARYGGASPLHEGFSLGVRMEDPDEAVVQTEQQGVQYYIERRDEWYFQEHNLHVNVDPTVDELIYSYEKA